MNVTALPFLVRHDRIVATWQPGDWPAGVLTGYREGDDFVLEHVIVFGGAPPTALMTMLRAGIEQAWALGCQRIRWHVPHRFAGAKALGEVGRRLGFHMERSDDTMAYYVRAR